MKKIKIYSIFSSLVFLLVVGYTKADGSSKATPTASTGSSSSSSASQASNPGSSATGNSTNSKVGNITGCSLYNESNLKHCLGCEVGFFLNTTTGNCSNCSSKCVSCNSSEVCTQCIYGTFLMGNTCYDCQENCFECKMLKSNPKGMIELQCLTCTDGYLLNKTMTMTVNISSTTNTSQNNVNPGASTSSSASTSASSAVVSSSSSSTSSPTSSAATSSSSSPSSSSLTSSPSSSTKAGLGSQSGLNQIAVKSVGFCVQCPKNCDKCQYQNLTKTSTNVEPRLLCTKCDLNHNLTSASTCVNIHLQAFGEFFIWLMVILLLLVYLMLICCKQVLTGIDKSYAKIRVISIDEYKKSKFRR